MHTYFLIYVDVCVCVCVSQSHYQVPCDAVDRKKLGNHAFVCLCASGLRVYGLRLAVCACPRSRLIDKKDFKCMMSKEA